MYYHSGHRSAHTSDREEVLPKKKKKAKKRTSPVQRFKKEFDRIIHGHLATLDSKERDNRINAAYNVATGECRESASTTQRAYETPQIRLTARSRE